MSLDLTGIAAYIQENPNEIASEAVLGLKSLDYLTVQPGVRSSMKVNKIVTDAILQAGGCGWSPSGTTTLSQRELTVSTYKVEEALCDEDLMPTIYQLIGKGANDENFSLENAYVDLKVKTIQNSLDNLIWKADTSGTDLFDGILKVATADVPSGNLIARTGSLIADIDSLIDLLPEGVLEEEGFTCAMSRVNFRALVKEFRTLDSNHIALFDQLANELTFPGTNLKVVGLPGLKATTNVVIYNQGNILVGTDLEADLSTSKFWWSQDNLEHRFHFGARIGVQIAIPEEVVMAV